MSANSAKRDVLSPADVVAGQLAAESAFKDVRPALESVGIDAIVLKGPHLAAVAYENAAQRAYTDLDLLVPESKFDEAGSAIVQLGYDPVKVPAGRYIRSYMSPHGWPVDIHRAFEAYGLFPIDYDELFERAEPFVFGQTRAMGLAREDLLIHLVIHAAKSLFREISYKHVVDVAMVARQPIRWDEFVARAEEVRCRTASWFLLSAAITCCSASIPQNVLVQLQPKWPRLLWLNFWLRSEEFPLFYREYLPNWIGRLVVLPAINDRIRDCCMSGLRFLRTRVRDVTNNH